MINTIFHGSRLPLQKWFLAIVMLVNAKKSISSHQLARDLDVPVKTAWSLSNKIRKAMLGNAMPILKGIVEMDETYIGGKPRYKGTSKPGRGTKKMPVIGAVERKGRVVAKPLGNAKMDARHLRAFMLQNIAGPETRLISDEYTGYSGADRIVKEHDTIKHAETYVDGDIHTNSIEGFWALVKRAYHGQHHHYSRANAHLYIGEACFKYNHRELINRRGAAGVFNGLLASMLGRA